ncbi:O-antigen ligase family protein [Demequina maris]|uniref:O-antigen ligase family protein n=1 Tax=Demequina maris TaxID=1638982 RepID=UPI0009E59BB4|nr:O-antigen ligase family protein [Demequina maris]
MRHVVAGWKTAAVMAVLVAVVYASVSTPLYAVLVVGLLIAFVAPTATMVTALAWVVLCRQGEALVHASVGGVAVSEIDGLLLLSVVAAIASQRGSNRVTARVPASFVVAIVSFPLLLLVRAALPTISSYQGSALVDIRHVVPYLALIPAAALVSRFGRERAVSALAALGYVPVGVAIIGSIGYRLGLIAPGESALMLVDTAGAVRPGGELLVVILAARVATGGGPLLARSRVLTAALIVLELLLSQTLSIALAVGGGALVAVLVAGKSRGSLGRVFGGFAALAFLGLLVTGAFGAESRFNLATRLSEDSAGYRFAELAAISDAVLGDPLLVALGAGPGSEYAFTNPYSGLIEVKGDAHNVYAAVILKVGVVGLVAYLWPYLSTLRRLRNREDEDVTAAVSSIVAVLAVGLTVPFAWSTQGWVVVVVLLTTLAAEDVASTDLEPTYRRVRGPRRSARRRSSRGTANSRARGMV